MIEETAAETRPRKRVLAAALAAGLLATGVWMWSSRDASAGESGTGGGKRSVQHEDHNCPGRDGPMGETSV